MRSWLRRGRLWLLSIASGGGLLALGACDPAVRETVLTGVGTAMTDLASTFIEAFIQSLMTQEEETATTVRAFIEYVPQLFA